jgi:hypothetical protein
MGRRNERRWPGAGELLKPIARTLSLNRKWTGLTRLTRLKRADLNPVNRVNPVYSDFGLLLAISALKGTDCGKHFGTREIP